MPVFDVKTDLFFSRFKMFFTTKKPRQNAEASVFNALFYFINVTCPANSCDFPNTLVNLILQV